MNRFGQRFCVTTWGESHGPAIGAVIDGCPAGLEIDLEELQVLMDRRRPGQKNTSPRNEADQVEILSGLFEGKTTGTPISLIIWNQDKHSQPYDAMKNVLRPGHANYTYLKKYGIFDHRGGGRASARETATRVAAAGIAIQLLKKADISISSRVEVPEFVENDSVGGVVHIETSPLPIGLGCPVFDRLEADLAKALMSIPATKGFEIGYGFQAAEMLGSEHNDGFNGDGLTSNQAGGTLGGISTGEPLVCRVAFKPTSTIRKVQETAMVNGELVSFALPPGHRHDPCVALRGAVVCEAMVALVLADHLLLNQTSKTQSLSCFSQV